MAPVVEGYGSRKTPEGQYAAARPWAPRTACAAAGIANPSRAAHAIVGRAMAAEVFPVRREIDDTFREKIEK